MGNSREDLTVDLLCLAVQNVHIEAQSVWEYRPQEIKKKKRVTVLMKLGGIVKKDVISVQSRAGLETEAALSQHPPSPVPFPPDGGK